MANGDSRQLPDVEPLSQAGDTRELLPRRLASERASAPAVAASPLPRATLDFRTIFELEIGYVMRTLRRLGAAPADLEGLAHDVFLAVQQRLNSYDRTRALRPSLFGFAFRVASHF